MEPHVSQAGLELTDRLEDDLAALTLLLPLSRVEIQVCVTTSGLCGARDQTQGFANAGQALDQLSCIPTIFLFNLSLTCSPYTHNGIQYVVSTHAAL